jgi:hypothetical protein
MDDSLEEMFRVDEGSVEKGAQKLGQRLGVVDIERRSREPPDCAGIE